ncbi:hypothetical protein [Erwinia sp. S38]|uniref:hypothetical protein n=1 Tax=Erwinia sp. S38 TaxID=2769338 RepID=UPI00190C45B8|nr:hypothetical protein [Erwinia sp. S38]MBK0001699.1 hypothetical protein [Erwinia sp. S38]
MSRKLFRQEAVDHQKSYWNGRVILLRGVSSLVISACCLAFLAAAIAILCCFNFTQRIDVDGEVTAPGV